MPRETTIDHVIHAIKLAKSRQRKVALLIGAGCSRSAGIPLARGFVKIFKEDERYTHFYEQAEEKEYADCMAQLSSGERHELIAEYVDKAQMNWAHIGVACLMKAGYVDRVLTTNFDPLIITACSRLNIFPAVYDLAASRTFDPDAIPEHAVFYLHGQRSGFVQLNTKDEVKQRDEVLEQVFQDCSRERTWIVIGYSGINDPVFDALTKMGRFRYRLFWIGYSESPPTHVRKEILSEKRASYYVKKWDADNFFVKLAQKLDCFLPPFIDTPFTHLNGIIEKIVAFPDVPEIEGSDVLKERKKWITAAISEFEKGEEKEPQTEADLAEAKTISYIQKLRMQGKYGTILKIWEQLGKDASPRIADEVAWAPILQAALFQELTKVEQSPSKTDELYNRAYDRYRLAMEIKPDKHEALSTWGSVLLNHAGEKTGMEADKLFKEAYGKFEAALGIKPDDHYALNNWGNALVEQAKVKTGKEADNLFKESYEKLLAALQIKPDNHNALTNWGNALHYHAQIKTGNEADKLYQESYEKFLAAMGIKPDDHFTLNNWGYALSDQARIKTGDAADKLYQESYEKFVSASGIKPDDPYTLNSWGYALLYQAQTQTGAEADRLFKESYEKFAGALEIKLDEHAVLSNWSRALSDQARMKTGAEADNLFQESYEKCAAALKIKPDNHYALNNWGRALSGQAKTKTGKKADKLFKEAVVKFVASLEIKPDHHKALKNWGTALVEQARTKTGKEASDLYSQAKKKLVAAENILPGSAAYNLACFNALTGNEKNCRHWLELGGKHGRLPSLKHIKSDGDLDSLRSKKWFKDFLKTHPDNAGK